MSSRNTSELNTSEFWTESIGFYSDPFGISIATDKSRQPPALPQDFNAPYIYATTLPGSLCERDSLLANKLRAISSAILTSPLNQCKTHLCENSNCFSEKYFEEVDFLRLIIPDPCIIPNSITSLQKNIADQIFFITHDENIALELTGILLKELEITEYSSPIQNKYLLLPKIDASVLQAILRKALSSADIQFDDNQIESLSSNIENYFITHTENLWPCFALKPHLKNVYLLICIARITFASLTQEEQEKRVMTPFNIPYTTFQATKPYLEILEEILTDKCSKFSYPPILQGYLMRVLNGIELKGIEDIFEKIQSLGYIKQCKLIASTVENFTEPTEPTKLEDYKKIKRRIARIYSPDERMGATELEVYEKIKQRIAGMNGINGTPEAYINHLWKKLLSLVEDSQIHETVLADYKLKELEALIQNMLDDPKISIHIEISDVAENYCLPDPGNNGTPTPVCDRCLELIQHYGETLEKVLEEIDVCSPDFVHPNFTTLTQHQKLPLQVVDRLKVRMAYQNKTPSIDELISYAESIKIDDSMFYQYLLKLKAYRETHQEELSLECNPFNTEVNIYDFMDFVKKQME